MKDYFERFKKLRYKEDPTLPVEVFPRVLWVDDDMVGETSLSRSMKKTMGVMKTIPEDIKVHYCQQEDAIDMLTENEYTVIILDNDSYRGRAIGPRTLEEIRKFDKNIPIIYTTDSPIDVSGFVKANVQEITPTHQLPSTLGGLLEKYAR